MLNKNNNKNMLKHNKNKSMFNFVKVTVDMSRGGMYVIYSNVFSLLKLCVVSYIQQLLYKFDNNKFEQFEFVGCEYNCYNNNDIVIGITDENSYIFTLNNKDINWG